jgi:cell division protein FtsW (lipid II flippase)
MAYRHQRIWLLVAAIAIVAALVLMLVPQAHSGHAANWLAILPVLFVGLLTPLTLSSAVLATNDSVRIPRAPALQPSFQRPPPLTIA